MGRRRVILVVEYERAPSVPLKPEDVEWALNHGHMNVHSARVEVQEDKAV